MLSCSTLSHLPSIHVQVMNCVICAFTMPCSSNVSCIVLYCTTYILCNDLYCTVLIYHCARYRDRRLYEGLTQVCMRECINSSVSPDITFRLHYSVFLSVNYMFRLCNLDLYVTGVPNVLMNLDDHG